MSQNFKKQLEFQQYHCIFISKGHDSVLY